MKTSHYPSIELCKKLTEIGFPETEMHYEEDGCIYTKARKADINSSIEWLIWHICPSVMEMLDVINSVPMRTFQIKSTGWKHFVWADTEEGSARMSPERDSLPNALAETILWINEEGHIRFPVTQ